MTDKVISNRDYVPLPTVLTQKIAIRAVQIARESMDQRGWKSGAALIPIYSNGKAGIKTEVHYLMFQEKGTKPFLMRSLTGKIVPMRNPSGTLSFVKCSEVGQPGWVWIPGRGNVWRDQKWKHPGIKPTNFMGNAIEQSYKEHQADIDRFRDKVLQYVRVGEL